MMANRIIIIKTGILYYKALFTQAWNVASDQTNDIAIFGHISINN